MKNILTQFLGGISIILGIIGIVTGIYIIGGLLGVIGLLFELLSYADTDNLKMIMEVYAHLDDKKEAVQEKLDKAISL